MSELQLENPHVRKLKGYAFDPSLSLQLDTFSINEIIYNVKWEELGAGPTGEYVEVIDYDPTVQKDNSYNAESGVFYKAVDLENKSILANSGLEPSDSNPQFHQQMVYAVAMTTISNFEKALGRKIIWSPRKLIRESMNNRKKPLNGMNTILGFAEDYKYIVSCDKI